MPLCQSVMDASSSQDLLLNIPWSALCNTQEDFYQYFAPEVLQRIKSRPRNRRMIGPKSTGALVASVPIGLEIGDHMYTR